MRQYADREMERPDIVNHGDHLMSIRRLLEGISEMRCVIYHDIKSIQLRSPIRKLLDAIKRRQVKLPHLGDALAPRGSLDLLLGLFSLVEVSARHDHLGSIELHKVLCYSQSKAWGWLAM